MSLHSARILTNGVLYSLKIDLIRIVERTRLLLMRYVHFERRLGASLAAAPLVRFGHLVASAENWLSKILDQSQCHWRKKHLE